MNSKSDLRLSCNLMPPVKQCFILKYASCLVLFGRMCIMRKGADDQSAARPC